MTKIIFISGIHGTGKTTIGQNLSYKLGIEFTSASYIIKSFSGQNWSKQKQVSNISINQDTLREGIRKCFSESKVIILDGHFALLNNISKISNIPEETFAQLDIVLIITCTLDVHLIKNRLFERDKTNFELDLLAEFQNAEIIQANKIAEKLRVPLIYFDTNHDDVDSIISKIKNERIIEDGI